MKLSSKKIPWSKSGEPWIWFNAGAIAISLVMVVGLILLIAVRGLSHFWPADVQQFQYHLGDEKKTVAGEIITEESVLRRQLTASNPAFTSLDKNQEWVTRYLIKTGNRDVYGLDFSWIVHPFMHDVRQPPTLMTVERKEWGNFYGYLEGIQENDALITSKKDPDAWQILQSQIERVEALNKKIANIQKKEMGSINYQVEKLRLKKRKVALDMEKYTADQITAIYASIDKQRKTLEQEFVVQQQRLDQLIKESRRSTLIATTTDGHSVDIPLSEIVRAYRPNAMGVWDKVGMYFTRLHEFIFTEPREANTEGGIFPAIFGTVMMVLVMSLLVTPFGVIAAVYLREYAKQGVLTRTVRIAVNNLAGVPSIVYGVFGLGFFVYLLGGSIDTLFYPESKPAPTFGTPGLLWASLTLALLTVPVVIVATEEGLSRIPRAIREGSLALGATKIETLWHTVIPMASPAIMTGVILAIARAAGEVAPLMLVGVVKLAPSLPLDGNFPYLHLERKFMHLGFHIYDVGFQSPNVEAARPLVYATAFVLIVVIVLLNVVAISIRNRLREQYKSLEN